MKKIVVLIVVFVLAFGTFTGCSKQKQSGSFVTITDFADKQVKIEEPVKSIVSMYGLATQMLYLLGEGDKVVASTKMAANDAFIKLVDPESAEKMKVVLTQNGVNVEEVAKLKPTFVIAAFWNSKEISKSISGLDIPVVTLNLETPDNFIKSLELLEKILQEDDKAKEIADYYRNALKSITEKTRSLKDKPKVLLVEYSMRSHALKVPGSEYFQNTLIELAGGESVSRSLPGGWNVVNAEQVAKWDPDVIITVSYSLKYSSEKVKESIMNDPAWKAVRAVKTGRVFAMPNDGESWDYPAPKWILGVYWTAKILHPDLFPTLNVKEEAANFYKKFYGVDIGNVKIVGDLR